MKVATLSLLLGVSILATMLPRPDAALSQEVQPAPASLLVTVTGLKDATGEVGCALYASADGFPMEPAKAVQQWLPSQAGQTECRFTDLAPGRYAVAISHDGNGNRRTDTGIFGIPKEAWGVSNNVRPGMRPPRFEEAAIMIAGGTDTRIEVEIAK